MKLALNVSGFTNKFPLEHCFDKLPGFDIAWEEIEEGGINFHQAMLLHQKELLTWMPDFNLGVSTLQFAELRFLFSLHFKSGIPEDLLKTMLSQLKKPYYYSFDCIYWDFASARWRYFIQQNQIQQLPNEDAEFEDYPSKNRRKDSNSYNTYYAENKLYQVKLANTFSPAFLLESEDRFAEMTKIKKHIILEEGDFVVFK